MGALKSDRGLVYFKIAEGFFKVLKISKTFEN